LVLAHFRNLTAHLSLPIVDLAAANKRCVAWQQQSSKSYARTHQSGFEETSMEEIRFLYSNITLTGGRQ